MNASTAQLIQNLIAGGLFLFWMGAAGFIWWQFKCERQEQTSEDQNEYQSLPIEIQPGEQVKTVSEIVAGNAADLARKAASQLAKGLVLGPVRVKAEGLERVAFMTSAEHAMGHPIQRGLLEFLPQGSQRTEIIATFVTKKSPRFLLRLGLVFSVLGLCLLVGVYVLIKLYVVNNINPMVRYQVFQMFQAIHLMWEPFLFGGIYLTQKSTHQTAISTATNILVHNLPYMQDDANQ